VSAEAQFLQFWEVYPRQVAIKAAQRAFMDAVDGGVDPHLLISKAKAFSLSVDPRRLEYVPHPASWLKAGQYEDNDLFTDQVRAGRAFLKKCWQKGDVRAIYEEYGRIYKKPPPPEELTGEELKRWDHDRKREWIAEQAKEILGDSARTPSN
jgi:hypothetical protein